MRRLGLRRRKELVERAQKLLPELPTGSLYRLTAILERILAEPDIEWKPTSTIRGPKSLALAW